MTTPLPLPMRVLIKGASTVFAMSEWNYPRDQFAFPREIEATLHEAGRPAEVRAIGIPSERARTTLKNWQREVLAWSPDVVVLVYGHYETVHFVLPWWLERHANSLKARPGRLRELYRTRVLRKAWVSLAKVQSKLDRKYAGRMRVPFLQNRPKTVIAHLERLITHVRSVGSPLVIVFELIPPSTRGASWFPGMATRIGHVNGAIAEMVKRLDDPDVRIFSVPDIVAQHIPDDVDPSPDGFHYTAPVHREIGRALGEQLLAWAETQPHLKSPG